MHKLVALMPMRHNSERVKGKNYRPFSGKPLYQHMLDKLVASPLIDKVVIDTDSEVIQEQLRRDYPDVIVVDRPPHLRDGAIPMNDVLLHDINQVEAEFYLQTHSTNPLFSQASLEAAISDFLDNFPVYDSLFAVTRLQTRIWNQLAQPMNHNANILLRTQDLPPIYEENSCLYIFTKDILLEKHNRIGNRPMMFETPPEESWDIDEEIDFKIAEFLHSEMNQKKEN